MTNTLAKECGRLEATNRELLEALKQLSNVTSLAFEIRNHGADLSPALWRALQDTTSNAKTMIAKAEKGG